jgi:Helix-turn-helix domain
MTQDDVLFGYRLQLFDLAARTTVAHACRTFGVHRSTYYRWKRQVERSGLEMLRPRERRRPRMPNQFPQVVEERIVAFSLGHPGLGPRRIARPARWPPVGRPAGVGQWGLEGAPPAWAQHPPPAAVADRRLPGTLRAALRTPARAPHPDDQARGAGRDRLVLRRSTARHQGSGVAANGDRHLQLLCLGGARALPPGRPLRRRPRAWPSASPRN